MVCADPHEGQQGCGLNSEGVKARLLTAAATGYGLRWIFCSSAFAMRVQKGFSRTMILTIPLRPGGHPAKPSPNTEPGGLQGTFSIWHVELYHLGCQDSLNRPPFT